MKLAGVREGEKGKATHIEIRRIDADVRVVRIDDRTVLTSFPSFNILGGL